MPAARPRALSVSYLTDTLPTLLPPIFEQVQHTIANHRKNIVSLRKIHEACSSIVEVSSTRSKLVGEKAFNVLFIDMVNRVLPLKKGVVQADKVVKFISSYVAYSTEQGESIVTPEGEEDSETFTTRFVFKLLKHLLNGTEAKDKNVRFRVTLLTVSMISGLGEMDDDLYVLLRECLLERSRDKEAAIRTQATLGLAKLQSGEDGDEEESLGDVLLDLLRYDPAAEVRRAALYNLSMTPATLPFILARTRDIDPAMRKIVYHNLLSATQLPDPRVLTISQREEAARNGLGDREAAVRKAASGMLGDWVDSCQGELVEFIKRFDVISSLVAEEALIAIFITRPEVFDAVEFEDEFWNTLTPEKAFLARVFVEHCMTTKDEPRLEAVLPVVTALAFRIQDEYNKLVASVTEEDSTERAFIVGELMKLAIHLDYADEIGRRKMFQLTREMISQQSLPEPLIPRCLDVLSKISDGERDLIRVVVDVVTELRADQDLDVDMDVPASQASSAGSPRKTPIIDMSDPEARMKAALIDLRCLRICISLLERVNSTLQENSVFHGLLPDLIVPAVKNKEVRELRDEGLICLGLCCMIDIKMAKDSFGLFVNQLGTADDEGKVKVVQIIFDLLMLHDIPTLTSMPENKIIGLVGYTLRQESEEVLAKACEGTAKLMLAGMISDDSVGTGSTCSNSSKLIVPFARQILHDLVLLYFSPETTDNQALRQCLTYFLPVYCYSAPSNQRLMLSIFGETFTKLCRLGDDLEDEQDLTPLSQMGMMMIDWMDPQKAVEREGVQTDNSVHLDLAAEVLKVILEETSKETRKTVVALLGKLNLPELDETEDWKVYSVILLIAAIQDKRPLADATSKNALSKFQAGINKKYATIVESFDEEAFRADERAEIQELCEIVDEVEEVQLDNQSEAGSARPSKIRTSRKRVSSTTEPSETGGTSDESDAESTATATTNRKVSTGSKGKKMQVVDEEEDDEDAEEDDDVDSILG
ncbi:condensin complex subunit 3, partial [Tremellales sp. Uapishka_1]